MSISLIQPLNDLAIVIPVYKDIYFRDTLESLVKQTNKRFTVYIGDDCSPFSLQEIVKEFEGRIDIVYHRFDTNVGGKDLVAQWERCIALTQGEPYIWLFSDDDMMDSHCVEEFYMTKGRYPECDVFRFDVKIIDSNNKVLRESKYPSLIESKDLYQKKIKGSLECFVVEYIFKRSAYQREKGFVKFDLAWGSDLATWVKLGRNTGIRSIQSTYVSWRSSGVNISTDYAPDILKRKTAALVECLKWGECEFQDDETRKINEKGLVSRLAQTASMTWYGNGWEGIAEYTASKATRVKLVFMYTAYYLVKKIRNVF